MATELRRSVARGRHRTYTLVGEQVMQARVFGAARPADVGCVVLVHGLTVSGRYMVPLAEELAADYRVLVPDLPGFGRSTKPGHSLDIPEMAEALAQWLRMSNVGRVALIGNSLGCQVIVDLAVRRPELVERVVLVGPVVDRAHRTVHQQVWRWLWDTVREPPKLWLVIGRDFFAAGSRRTLRTFQHALDYPLEDLLPRVRVPALVVRGGRDPLASREWVATLARLLPHGRMAEIPEATHVANFANPHDLARLVRGFLRDNGQEATG